MVLGDWCAQRQLLQLEGGLTSSLLTEIPTTPLPPRIAEDIVNALKATVAINLD